MLLTVVSAAAISGCANDVDTGQIADGLHEVVFHAGWDSETKTMLQEDGNIFWMPGDSIQLFYGNDDWGYSYSGGWKLISTNVEPSGRVDFIGEIGYVPPEATKYIAVYPYDESNKNNYPWGLAAPIPTVQTAVAGSFDPKAFRSCAISEDNHLYFKNLYGGIKFSVSQEGIKEVSFRFASGGAMSGYLGANFNGDKFRYSTPQDWRYLPPEYRVYSEEVIVRAPDDSYLEVGKDYYAVIYPLEKEDQIIVTFKKETSQAHYITESPISIERSVFKRLDNKDANLTFTPRKDEAVMIWTLPDSLRYNGEAILLLTEVYFHPLSDHTTDVNLGTEDGPIYFELIDGTAVHYYTPKESFNIKNVARGMFAGWRLNKADLTGVDASEVTDFSNMFLENNLKNLDLSNFDTSCATNMSCMFRSCKYLESLDLSSFNTEHVTNMSAMFEHCRNLRELNLSSFNTSSCTDMSSMFNLCGSLRKLDLANFDVSSVIYSSYMCYNLATHRKRCFIKASEETRNLLCSDGTMMPKKAMDTFITWLSPTEAFPSVVDPFPDLYKSVDYSRDKTYSLIQTATKGKGLDVVILGDAYSDRLIDDGTYDRDLGNAIEHIFSEAPLNMLRDYFNVYVTYAVSENESLTGVTALDVVVGDEPGEIGGSGSAVEDYMLATIPDYEHVSPDVRPIPIIIIVANLHEIAATIEKYTSGSSIIYTSLGLDETSFHELICGEFGSNIGGLANDESGYTIYPSLDYPNLDIPDDQGNVKWNHFLNDDRYANQGLGVFRRGFYCFPTETSILYGAATGFNAPCREAIYKRVHELADESFVYDYETFVAFDQASMAGVVEANRKARECPLSRMKRLPPPVFIADSPHGVFTTERH